jgi:hypothetical protein
MEWRLPAQLPWQLQVQHVSLILQRSVGFQQWNGDAVAPATPGALRTRIPDAGRKAWFSGNGSGLACQQVPLRGQPPLYSSLWDWASVMEMESGEDVRGSQPRQQVVLAVQPYTGGLWQG